MCTATLCNLCYIVVCCELLVYFSDKKSAIPQQLYKTASHSLSAIAELLVNILKVGIFLLYFSAL